MKKLITWLDKHQKLAILFLFLVIFLPIIIIHCLFKIETDCNWIRAEWSAGDVLSYFGSVLSFLGTITLGYVAIQQTEKANSMSNELLKLEWEKRKPFLDIIQNQEYGLYFSEESISNCLMEYNTSNDMIIRPCYIRKERTGYTTIIAVMRIVAKNIGNSDIRHIFLKTNLCYLTPQSLPEFDDCVAYVVDGNTYLKAGESRHLFIEFRQELRTDTDNAGDQTKWAVDSTTMIPSFDFDLELVTSDGTKYKENLAFGTSFRTESEKIVRTLGTTNISVNRIE